MAYLNNIDLNEFKKMEDIIEPMEAMLVVKSQDQALRRAKLISQLKEGRIGRMKPRPISEGLLVNCRLHAGGDNIINTENASWVRRFPEPRHMVPCSRNSFLLTEIGKINLIGPEGSVLDSFTHPYFAFLHTVELNASRDRILVTSSGYDAIIEIDLNTKNETWSWFGWDHGFNPNEDGVYFTNTRKKSELLARRGLNARYIDPGEYNEQGLLTAARTTHPNAAIYNPYKEESTVVASLGRKGRIIEIEKSTGKYSLLIDSLAPMPHGITPYNGGWIITNTTEGELWMLDEDFNIQQQIIVNRLSGKPEVALQYEWLQLVKAIDRDTFVGLDANRGIIIFDLAARCYSILHPDPNWCIQDILLFRGEQVWI